MSKKMENIVCRHSTDFLVKMSEKYKEKSDSGLNPKIKLFSQSKKEDSQIVETSVLIFSDDESVVRITYDSNGTFFGTCQSKDFEIFCQSQT